MRSQLAAWAFVLAFLAVFVAGGFIMGWRSPMWPDGLALVVLGVACGFIAASWVYAFADQGRGRPHA